MSSEILLALYGAIVIGGLFLVFNMGRLALTELWEKGPKVALREVYFWLSLNHAAQGIFIGGICVIRGLDLLLFNKASSYPWVLVAMFGGLLLTKTGFNYASTMTMRRGRLAWRLLIVATLAWWAFVALFLRF